VIITPSPASKVRRIAILSTASRDGGAADETALTEGLRELGWIERDNLSIERRYAGGRTELLPELAADLVRLDPEVIVTTAQQASLAARRQTTAIPIVAASLGGDPVATGLVASLAVTTSRST
jgi:putative ABC transport system substrate-binding protein